VGPSHGCFASGAAGQQPLGRQTQHLSVQAGSKQGAHAPRCVREAAGSYAEQEITVRAGTGRQCFWL
jgi:hypothetical protein